MTETGHEQEGQGHEQGQGHEHWLRQAIALAAEGAAAGAGGPFGAVVVRGEQVIGRGYNRVPSTLDPTAHAEICAIRAACQEIGAFSLQGARIYASCEPCPMCLAAIYWARLDALYYAATRADAAAVGFDDARIYAEIALPVAARGLPTRQLLREAAVAVQQDWLALPGRIPY
jgi:tRNA(Arg) A34 adenosine deaminase TadA